MCASVLNLILVFKAWKKLCTVLVFATELVLANEPTATNRRWSILRAGADFHICRAGWVLSAFPAFMSVTVMLTPE